MNQPIENSAATPAQLTGFVSEISIPVNPAQLDGICTLSADARAHNDDVTVIMYEYVEDKLRHAAGNGGQTHCQVHRNEFVQACARRDIDEPFADLVWRQFCRFFVV